MSMDWTWCLGLTSLHLDYDFVSVGNTMKRVWIVAACVFFAAVHVQRFVLAPWMLMYALSTLAMTHRDLVRSFYRSESPAMETERELDYSRVFPTGTTREQMATQILRDIGLVGAHYVGGGKDGKPLIITRQHALATRRELSIQLGCSGRRRRHSFISAPDLDALAHTICNSRWPF